MTETTTAHPAIISAGRFYALRLKPGEDVLDTLQAFVAENNMLAAGIVTVVGSLTHAMIRYAARPTGALREGLYEIVSMIGTLEATGGHVHISCSDENGDMFGGHMLSGCITRTTCEIVLVELTDLAFSREYCPLSTWDELVVKGR
jgi:predicted DNA-binding protein with PD1-like motif